MRKLMWFTIGFAAACAAGICWLSGFWLLLLSLLAAMISVFTFVSPSCASAKLRVAFLGCAVAFLWVWIFQGVYINDLQQMHGQTLTAQVCITDYHTQTDWGISADGMIRLNGKPYRIRVYTSHIEQLSPGDTIEGEIQLDVTTDIHSKYAYQSANGTFVLGYLKEDAQVKAAEQTPVICFPAVLRYRIINLLNELFPKDTLPFARALLLGDRSLLDYKTNTNLSVSGIRHVVAVSGLHVSILFSVVYFVFGYRRVITPVVGWIVLFVFAGVAGFSPSVMRACIMHSLMLGSLFFQKEYDAPTALSFAVLLMLLVNPLAVTSVGLQLSVGCVVGILLFSERIRVFLLEKCLKRSDRRSIFGKLKNWLAASVSVTVSTLITTTPLCAVYFGTVSLIGVITNVLTLWVVTVIFCGILATCIAGAVTLSLGNAVAFVVSWLIRYVLFIANILAKIPFAAVYTASSYVIIWIVFCYILLILYFTDKKRSAWIMLLCMSLGLVIASFASWLEPRMDSYRLSVLDVGQGQCVLIQQDGKNYMVDCGGDHNASVADKAAQLLLSQGVYKLDGMILTHYDADHAGAAIPLLERVPAERLYLPLAEDTGTIYTNLTDRYQDRITWVEPKDTVRFESIDITLFGGNNTGADNEKGLCVLFQSPDCDILITGDMSKVGEKFLLEQTTLPDLEVLVVGHHGAANATGLELLRETMPEVAIISVGKNNRYGQPSPEVLQRLDVFACNVFRTDIDGDIVIRG